MFHLAQCSAELGRLGQSKTLSCIMACFSTYSVVNPLTSPK